MVKFVVCFSYISHQTMYRLEVLRRAQKAPEKALIEAPRRDFLCLLLLAAFATREEFRDNRQPPSAGAPRRLLGRRSPGCGSSQSPMHDP